MLNAQCVYLVVLEKEHELLEDKPVTVWSGQRVVQVTLERGSMWVMGGWVRS